VTERIFYNVDGSVQSKTGYAHDDHGNLVEMLSHNSSDTEGASVFKWAYSYDQMDRIAKEVAFNSDGSIQSKKRYVYHVDGSLLRRNDYAYKNGRIISRIDRKADGSIEGRFIYQYNAAGKLKKVVKDESAYFTCGAFHIEEEFRPVEFDFYGNWTKSIGAQSVTYRIITYH
jgi:hypothetical protein